ncbi:MAG: hypothetical protein WBG86_05775 [Polyangiales bacterium]
MRIAISVSETELVDRVGEPTPKYEPLLTFPETLTTHRLLEPLGSFVIQAGGAKVTVTDNFLGFSVDLDAGLRRSYRKVVS